MAKQLKENAIVKNDLLEFLNSYSDFSFELSILKMLREKMIDCEHGGLYEDPVTGKSREFDIRAIKTISHYRVRLAIECKNIRKYFPILISCVPRHIDESYHQIAIVNEPRFARDALHVLTDIRRPRAKTINVKGDESIYKPNTPVGKSTVQVGRAKNDSIVSHDSELYDKWSQSLSSSTDLVKNMYWDGDKDDSESWFFSAIFPIIVVPNGRLWIAEYDTDGNRIIDPSQTTRCSCFIDKNYGMGTEIARTSLWISHIEIMTYDGIFSFIDDYLSDEKGMKKIFSEEVVGTAKQWGSDKIKL